MAVSKYKSLISQKVVDVLKKSYNNGEISPKVIESIVSLNINKNRETVQFQLPFNEVRSHYKDIKKEHFHDLINLKKDSILLNVSGCSNKDNEPLMMFDLDKDLFVKNILSDKEYLTHLKNPKLGNAKLKEKFVIEFSSPNVAKPFHMGHFRSTIIGNYLSNLYEYLSYDIVRLTYLGDWGTQFGLLQIGLDDLGLSIEEISKAPTEILFKAYVNANKKSNNDSSILSQAKQIFNSMELGNNDNLLEKWKTIRQFTSEDLKNTYNRLGVEFSDYDWESNYPAKRSASIIDLLKSKNYLVNEDGKLVFRSKSGLNVTVLKSDGSSLYITRDILAATERKSKYNFDKMIYVTDFSQQDHFIALNEILTSIDNSWTNKIEHVKYGRIRGMSTRKGEVVFLKDILDEARDIMAEKQKASHSR